MSNDTIKMLNQILVGQKIAEVRRSELSKKYKELANQLEVVLDSGGRNQDRARRGHRIMRDGAKCEAYGAPCKNLATKLIEIWDDKKDWVTILFCDYCSADFVRECADDPDFGPVKL